MLLRSMPTQAVPSSVVTWALTVAFRETVGLTVTAMSLVTCSPALLVSTVVMVMVVSPSATPVMTPSFTVAMLSLAEVQVSSLVSPRMALAETVALSPA